MSTIAVIITDMFEDSEYSEPAAAFKNAGHKLVHIGLKTGETVKGKKQETPVEIDKGVKDISVDEFDALLIPGGYSPDKLRVDEDAVRSDHRGCDQGPQDHRMEISHPGYQERRSRVHRPEGGRRRQPDIEPEPWGSSGIY